MTSRRSSVADLTIAAPCRRSRIGRRLGGRGVRVELHRAWRTVLHGGRLIEENLDLDGAGGIGAEDIAAKGLDHVGRRHRAMFGEFHDGAHDQLRLFGRRETDEPPVVVAVGVLRGARLAGHCQVGMAASRRRAVLHDGDQRGPEPVELLGAEPEGRGAWTRPAERDTATRALPSPASPS